MDKDEAMKLALEALEWSWGGEPMGTKEIEAITALRQALDHVPDTTKMIEPDMGVDRGAWDDVPDATKWVDELRGGDETEQEPVTWRNAAIRLGEDLYSVGPNGYYDMTASQWLDWALSVVNTAPPKQPEQEPVAWVKDLTSAQPRCVTDLKYISVADTEAGVQYIPLYTAPPKQEPPTASDLLCVCGAGWEWRNRDWELVETPSPKHECETCANKRKRLEQSGFLKSPLRNEK